MLITFTKVEPFLATEADENDRFHAILVYGGMGAKGREAAKRLKEFADGDNTLIRIAAAAALFRLFHDKQQARAYAVQKLKLTPEYEVRKLIVALGDRLTEFRRIAREGGDDFRDLDKKIQSSLDRKR